MKPMSLWEYAEKYPRDMTETERKIGELEAQLWDTDFRNDPAWERAEQKAQRADISRNITVKENSQ